MNIRGRSTRSTTLAAATALAALTAAVLVPAGTAQAAATSADDATGIPSDQQLFATEPHLENPLGEKREALKQEAHQQLITGQASPRAQHGSEVVELADGEFVEVATTGTDKIFTILVEFGDEIHPEFGGTRGPLANEIAEPDRAVDNSTIWQRDFNREHYQELYYGTDPAVPSVKQYFESQSSGRYSIDGTVTDWVKVDYNEARYGNSACGSNVCRSVWEVVTDGVNAWYDDQIARGLTPDEVREILAEYDQYDRYDYNNDGNFNEPDGYLDHFQIVHAGEDASAGGGAQGDDAIWAHRWYAYADQVGLTGPPQNLAGGVEIGGTGIWVGDYTIQPENGGVGVFAHEYAHDLGLPDLYDTSGGENGTGFWSAMSSGSWLSDKNDGAIGTLPNDMGPWEKLQLGWLDYDVARAATRSTHVLGASSEQFPEGNRRFDSQALVVELPAKTVTSELVAPAQGETQWWSGSGDNLSHTLTRTVDLTGATSASLDLTGWWSIEQDYDFLYVEASTDGGASFTPLAGTGDGTPLPTDSAGRTALHGESGGQVALSYPLDDFAGQSVELRFRYLTDGALTELGFTADEITVTADGATVFSDDAENGVGDWRVNGFSLVGASITDDYPQFYIAENRQYTGFDRTLKHGPYNFGFLDTKDDWVEHYAYQTGLLVWLWDTSHSDNNTRQHPGEGLILPVDASPVAEKWSDGTLLRNRIQSRDATFSLFPTPKVTLHKDGVPTTLAGHRGVPVFDDRKGDYWDPANPWNSVVVPDTNTKITILTQSPTGSGKIPMILHVAPSAR